MDIRNLRWPVVAAVAAAALLVLFGATKLVRYYAVEKPLGAVLHGAASIETASVEKRGEALAIRVRLKEVHDLQSAYTALDHEIRQTLAQAPYTLQIEDRRTTALEEDARPLNLYMHDALATGRFAEAAERIAQTAGERGLQARFGVDEHRVYLQVQRGGAYLYQVVERHTAGAVPAEGGGGL